MKCINGEKAAYNTAVFATKREQTFEILLEEANLQYGKEESKAVSSRTTLSDNLQEASRIYGHRFVCLLSVGET